MSDIIYQNKEAIRVLSSQLDQLAIHIEKLEDAFVLSNLNYKEDKPKTTERQSDSWEAMLYEIPPCSYHGIGCVPHAIEWVKRMVRIESSWKTDRQKEKE